MKWLPTNGSTQHSADGRYCIVQANSQHWIAYELTPYATGNEIATTNSDDLARQMCEDHELARARKRA